MPHSIKILFPHTTSKSLVKAFLYWSLPHSKRGSGHDHGGMLGGVPGPAVIYGVPAVRLRGVVRGWGEGGGVRRCGDVL
jgi:hypothetical protein